MLRLQMIVPGIRSYEQARTAALPGASHRRSWQVFPKFRAEPAHGAARQQLDNGPLAAFDLSDSGHSRFERAISVGQGAEHDHVAFNANLRCNRADGFDMCLEILLRVAANFDCDRKSGLNVADLLFGNGQL